MVCLPCKLQSQEEFELRPQVMTPWWLLFCYGFYPPSRTFCSKGWWFPSLSPFLAKQPITRRCLHRKGFDLQWAFISVLLLFPVCKTWKTDKFKVWFFFKERTTLVSSVGSCIFLPQRFSLWLSLTLFLSNLAEEEKGPFSQAKQAFLRGFTVAYLQLKLCM